MPRPSPRLLSENSGLAFVGERTARPALIPPGMAARMLGRRNPHGKPNADVLRQLVGSLEPGPSSRLWQVDFPPDLTEREAALYELPFHHLYRTVRPIRERWWVNRHANPHLRAALAKRERYLAAPVAGRQPDFRWVDSALLPADGLLAVARDDDFTHGVLRSRPFALWWRRHHSRLAPTAAVASFPFPWPPATPLHALTAAQEESRHALARAARADDGAAIASAVAAAYGWPGELTDDAMLARLAELNGQRAGRTS